MRHFKIDGRDKMLNERETAHWCETGCLQRISEGDEEDARYVDLRDRMLRNGDETFYKECCP